MNWPPTSPEEATVFITVVLVVVNVVAVVLSLFYLNEARTGRRFGVRPYLAWQDGFARQCSNKDMDIWAEYKFSVRSVGPGWAFVSSARAAMDSGDEFRIDDLRTPVALPPGAHYEFTVTVPRLVERHLSKDDKKLRIEINYADIEGRDQFKTWAEFPAGGGSISSPTSFSDVDVRPAEKRKVHQPSRLWPWNWFGKRGPAA